MNSEWPILTVDELVFRKILAPPLDGNHGSIHPKASDFLSKGIPFIMASDLVNGRVDFKKCVFLNEIVAKKLRKGFAKSGGVLLSHKATIGRTALVQETEFAYIILTPQITYYRILNTNELDNRYLKYYFDSIIFQELLMAWAGAGSTRSYLGITAQRKLPIACPPLNVQKYISSILASFDDRIENLREINTTLEAITQVLFKSWFIDFDPVRAKAEGRKPEGIDDETAALFPDSFEESELGLVPKGWNTISVYELAEYVNGAAYKMFEPNEERKGLPIIKIAELKAGVTMQTRYSAVHMPEKYKIDSGDILFSWSGNPDTSIDIFVWTYGKAWLNQHIFKVIPRNQDERSFILMALKYDGDTLNRTSNLNYYKPEKYHDQESKQKLYARI